MNATMRIPCSRCGQLNNVERAAEVSFRCTACGSANSSNCASVWTVAAPNKPGDTFLAHVAIRNPGNIAASILQIEATTANTCDSAPGVVDGAITYKGSNQAGLTSTLSGATAIGATSFTLASAANFTIGEFIQVDTGTNFENLTISNIVG